MHSLYTPGTLWCNVLPTIHSENKCIKHDILLERRIFHKQVWTRCKLYYEKMKKRLYFYTILRLFFSLRNINIYIILYKRAHVHVRQIYTLEELLSKLMQHLCTNVARHLLIIIVSVLLSPLIIYCFNLMHRFLELTLFIGPNRL